MRDSFPSARCFRLVPKVRAALWARSSRRDSATPPAHHDLNAAPMLTRHHRNGVSPPASAPKALRSLWERGDTSRTFHCSEAEDCGTHAPGPLRGVGGVGGVHAPDTGHALLPPRREAQLPRQTGMTNPATSSRGGFTILKLTRLHSLHNVPGAIPFGICPYWPSTMRAIARLLRYDNVPILSL